MKTADIKVGGEYAFGSGTKYWRGKRVRVDETGVEENGTYTFSAKRKTGVRVTYLDDESGRVLTYPLKNANGEDWPEGSRQAKWAGEPMTGLISSRDVKEEWFSYAERIKAERAHSEKKRDERQARESVEDAEYARVLELTGLAESAPRFGPSWGHDFRSKGVTIVELTRLLEQAYEKGRMFEHAAEVERAAQEES